MTACLVSDAAVDHMLERQPGLDTADLPQDIGDERARIGCGGIVRRDGDLRMMSKSISLKTLPPPTLPMSRVSLSFHLRIAGAMGVPPRIPASREHDAGQIPTNVASIPRLSASQPRSYAYTQVCACQTDVGCGSTPVEWIYAGLGEYRGTRASVISHSRVRSDHEHGQESHASSQTEGEISEFDPAQVVQELGVVHPARRAPLA
jgi:hypothetical protein